MDIENSFYNLGVKLACAARGKDVNDIIVLEEMLNKVADTKAANYGYAQRMICKVASEFFAEAGLKDEYEFHLFDKLANAPQWFPEMDDFSDAAQEGIGRVALEMNEEAQTQNGDAVVKFASGILPAALSMAGRSTPEVVKTMAGAGALGGGVMGGLYWLMNRHTKEDEDEAEVIKAKIDYYNRVSGEIKRQLANKGRMNTDEAKRTAKAPAGNKQQTAPQDQAVPTLF